MATKKKAPSLPKKQSSHKSRAEQDANDEKAKRVANVALQPTVQAALTLKEYGKENGELELMGLIAALSEQVSATSNGDLSRTEAALASQAHTLDAIFNNLARRAINAPYLSGLEQYLKLALRAQSQCRATLETLAGLKNPQQAPYVRQTNIAHGPQQVNNNVNVGTAQQETSDNGNLQSKLMEKSHGERVDTRATGTTSRADTAMATVGEINRADDDRG